MATLNRARVQGELKPLTIQVPMLSTSGRSETLILRRISWLLLIFLWETQYQSRKRESYCLLCLHNKRRFSNPPKHTRHSVYLLLIWAQISCLLWNSKALQIPYLPLFLQLKAALSTRCHEVCLPILKSLRWWWDMGKGKGLWKPLLQVQFLS